MILNEYGQSQLEQRIEALDQSRRVYRSTHSAEDRQAYDLAARELAEFVAFNRDVIFYLYDESGPDGLRGLLRADQGDGSDRLRGLLRSDGCSGPAAPTGSDGSGATG